MPSTAALADSSPHSHHSRLAIEVGRDPFVRIQIATFAVTAVLYLPGVLTPEHLKGFSRFWLCLVMMVWPTIGAFAGLGKLPALERPAWRLIGGALACWLAALIVFAAWPVDRWSPIENGVEAVLYMAYYLFMIFGVGAMPLDGRTANNSSLERRLARYGLVVFVSVWVMYIVVLPGILDQQFSGEVIVDSPMSLVLGVAVIAQATFRRHKAATARSRAILGSMILLSAALLLTDSLNWLGVLGVAEFDDAYWTDVFWTLPGLAAIVVARMPYAKTAPNDGAPAANTEEDDSPVTLGIYLMFGGLSFLLIDALLRIGGVLNLTSRRSTALVELTLVAGSLAMMTLAAMSHWLLSERSARLHAERQQLQARLDESSKMEALGRLAGGVAHDFNNLLTVIGGSSDLLMLELPSNSSARELVAMNRDAVDRAASLTRQLLVFSSRHVVDTATVNTQDAINHMTEMVRRIIGETVKVVVSHELSVPPTRINLAQFEQVVMNLVINARDAMNGAGTITISTHRLVVADTFAVHSGVLPPGVYAGTTVSDTGPGIDERVRARMFEPFFTTKSAGGGRGVGLATAFGIVRQNGGGFSVASTPSMGASLTFYLPAAPAEPASTISKPVATTAARHETLLLAEDDDAVRATTRALLAAFGYTVLEAATPQKALELCAAHSGKIDLLLTDVVMPEMAGPELAQRVVTLRPATKVLLMSGYTGDNLLRDPATAAVPFIAKPFSAADLSSRIREVLDAST